MQASRVFHAYHCNCAARERHSAKLSIFRGELALQRGCCNQPAYNDGTNGFRQETALLVSPVPQQKGRTATGRSGPDRPIEAGHYGRTTRRTCVGQGGFRGAAGQLPLRSGLAGVLRDDVKEGGIGTRQGAGDGKREGMARVRESSNLTQPNIRVPLFGKAFSKQYRVPALARGLVKPVCREDAPVDEELPEAPASALNESGVEVSGHSCDKA